MFFSPTEFHSRAAVQKPLDPSSLTHRQHTRARPVLVPPRVRSADGRVALLVFFCFVFFKSLLLSSSFIIFYFEFSGSTGRIQNEFFFSPYLTGLCVWLVSLFFFFFFLSLFVNGGHSKRWVFVCCLFILFSFRYVSFLLFFSPSVPSPLPRLHCDTLQPHNNKKIAI